MMPRWKQDAMGAIIMAENKEKWHAGKEIPVALIFAIIIQTAGVVW